MTFPHEERLDLSGMHYVEEAEWKLFYDLEGERKGLQVMMILEDRYTVMDGVQFKAVAERVLKQL